MSKQVILIIATDENQQYAYLNDKGIAGIPWNSKKDFEWFKYITSLSTPEKQNAIIIGRKSYESIPESFRPLVSRRNFIISSQDNNEYFGEENNLHSTFKSVKEALKFAQSEKNINKIFICGGMNVYKEAITLGSIDVVLQTDIRGKFGIPSQDYRFSISSEFKEYNLKRENTEEWLEKNCNSLEKNFVYASTSNDPFNCINIFSTFNPSEDEYLNVLNKIIITGIKTNDRTGVGTFSTFGQMLKFPLSNSTLPLLTTKNVFTKGVLEELLWFIKGETYAKKLRDKGVHIWDGNGSREFLDSRGLVNNEEFDLGPVYGFQWRHFGATYEGHDKDYTGKGVDQLKNIIELIKKDPTTRRAICIAWNPLDLDNMALPPCHMSFMFKVYDNKLSCCMFQRSADWFLGVPFNIASYAMLTHIIAQQCNLEAGELVMQFGDAHLYQNHLEQANRQLKRKSRNYPKFIIKNKKENLDDYEFEDFEINGYYPYPGIKAPMAV